MRERGHDVSGVLCGPRFSARNSAEKCAPIRYVANYGTMRNNGSQQRSLVANSF